MSHSKIKTLMKKIFQLCFALLLGVLFLSFASSAKADDKVNTSAQVNYAISDSGNTHVTAHITLTNTTANFYVSSYSLKLGFGTVSNVTASEPDGAITPTVKQTDSGQEVTLNFKSVVAGKGNSLPFTLSFDTPDIASHNGTIWEVNIPGLATQTDFQSFIVDVTPPGDFGKPTFIKPDTSSDILHFTKEQLGQSGISIVFGNSQTYSYTLNYHLENTNVFPVRTEIALPPTTNYQDVSLENLSPKPNNVTLDTDGNWLAQYTLGPSEKKTITASGLISVHLNPSATTLSSADRKLFLQKQPYWQIDDSHIASLAKSLKTPEAIYDYVVSHLTYDFNRVKNDQVRIGAAGVLQDTTSAVCLEFTDLFVALSRAAGIPAREIDGFAYTQNTISRPLSLSKDVLHAWPEYYDDNKKTWVMVDPTWGNTTGGVDYFHTLDFDHVAFVIKGTSSTYPVPAGGYKFGTEQNVKDVQVTVTQEQITDQPTISMNLTVPQTVMGGLPLSGSVQLANTGSVLFPRQPIEITTKYLSPNHQFVTMPAVPPFGSSIKAIYFGKTAFLTNKLDTITITLGGKTVSTQVSIVPLTKQYVVIGGIALVILIATIWILTASAWRLPIFR